MQVELRSLRKDSIAPKLTIVSNAITQAIVATAKLVMTNGIAARQCKMCMQQ